MCGIAGRFHHSSLPPDSDWHDRARRLLAHRGPDGEGSFRDERCELVHTRLAIIDLSPTGTQPMANEDGAVQVVYNGEIYNHLELRQELAARGHRFRGTSDTEVLVHLYEEEGPRLVERLRGMFAFAIYDQRRRALLLARDRYGIKPLFYSLEAQQVLFASEIKAILAAAGAGRQVDRQACYDFLGLGYIPEPATGFAGILALPRGTTLLVDREGAHMTRYFTLRAQPQVGRNLEELVSAAEERLLRVARAQSRADVPVAALLSGGIDSSLVVAALCRATGGAPNTFNVRFPDEGYDETAMALAVARAYGTKHRTIDLEERELDPETVASLLRHFDQPFADSSLIPTYWVCRAIRENGIICTLSGDGGDEAFGGYASFWRINHFDRLMRLPGFVTQLIEGGGEALVPLTRDLGRRVAKAARIADRGRRNVAELLASLYNYLNEGEKEDLIAPEARSGLQSVERLFGGTGDCTAGGLEALSRRLTECVFALGLPGDMLRKVDMMSMRARIEVRVPFLDEEIVDFGLGLPHALKTDGRQGKLVLRALARRWLPAEVAAHRKQGFSIPLDRMVGGGFHAMLAEVLLSPEARIRRFLRMEKIERWIAWFRQARGGKRRGEMSREGIYQRIFILLALELWLREQRLTW